MAALGRCTCCAVRLAQGLDDFLAARVMQGAAIKGCARRLPTLAEAARAAATDPQAVAVVELVTPLPANARAWPLAEGGIAVAPTPVNLRSEDYPLVQRYSVYGGQMMSALGRSLALYLISPPAQRVVAAQGLMAMSLPRQASRGGAGHQPGALPRGSGRRYATAAERAFQPCGR